MAALRVMALLAVAVMALPSVLTKSCRVPFVAVENKWCVYANLTISIAPFEAKTWSQSRSYCHEANSDLVVLDSHEKARAINRYVDAKYTGDEQQNPLWIGGHKVQGEWRWVNDIPINMQSHIWLPGNNYPTDPKNVYAYLTQKASWERRYIESSPSTQILPGHICEY